MYRPADGIFPPRADNRVVWGGPAFGILLAEAVDGKTPVIVDRVTIETLG